MEDDKFKVPLSGFTEPPLNYRVRNIVLKESKEILKFKGFKSICYLGEGAFAQNLVAERHAESIAAKVMPPELTLDGELSLSLGLSHPKVLILGKGDTEARRDIRCPVVIMPGWVIVPTGLLRLVMKESRRFHYGLWAEGLSVT